MTSESDVHVAPAECDIGVMVGGFGEGADLVDEMKRGSDHAMKRNEFQLNKHIDRQAETGGELSGLGFADLAFAV